MFTTALEKVDALPIGHHIRFFIPHPNQSLAPACLALDLSANWILGNEFYHWALTTTMSEPPAVEDMTVRY